mmetsp:Transcript_7452/g.30294  ORF Transcript_7452/g.30294 Transcript_7452/m.30294 type:complete len:239 (-) Transcript_7452:195-911(-)
MLSYRRRTPSADLMRSACACRSRSGVNTSKASSCAVPTDAASADCSGSSTTLGVRLCPPLSARPSARRRPKSPPASQVPALASNCSFSTNLLCIVSMVFLQEMKRSKLSFTRSFNWPVRSRISLRSASVPTPSWLSVECECTDARYMLASKEPDAGSSDSVVPPTSASRLDASRARRSRSLMLLLGPALMISSVSMLERRRSLSLRRPVANEPLAGPPMLPSLVPLSEPSSSSPCLLT